MEEHGRHSFVNEIVAAKTFAALEIALGDRNQDVRATAAVALARLGYSTAIPTLVQQLTTPGARSRTAAAAALGILGDDGGVEPLIGALRYRDYRLRAAAVRALGRIGSPRAVDALVARLRDGVVEVREAAAKALGSIGDARAVEPIVAAFSERYGLDPIAGLDALGQLGDPSAVPHLLRALGHHRRGVSEAAAGALDRVNPLWRDGELAALAMRNCLVDLTSHDARIRTVAVRTLGFIASSIQPEVGEDIVAALVRALSDRRACVRTEAATAMGRIGDRRATQALVTALNDRVWPVRAAVVRALARLGDDAAVEYIVGALGSESHDVSLASIRALGDLGSPAAAVSLATHLVTTRGYRAEASEVIKALVQVNAGATSAVEILIRALDDSDVEVRERSAWALGEIGAQQSVLALIARLDDLAGRVRRAAATALGALKASGGVPKLLSALEDADLHVRQAAAEALGAIGDSAAVDPLLDVVMRYDEGAFSAKAAVALGRIGDTRCLPRLLAAFGASSLWTRGGLIEAFGHLKSTDAVGVLLNSLSEDPLRHPALQALDSIDPDWRSTPEAEALRSKLREDLRRALIGGSEHAARKSWSLLYILGCQDRNPDLLFASTTDGKAPIRAFALSALAALVKS